jgi:Tol biopolymer transport system component
MSVMQLTKRGRAHLSRSSLIMALGCLWALSCLAQRAAVLGQIELPHPYYYREMYLPQLTGGPSSVTWSPDGQSVIFSMAGSLWRQNVTSTVAQQLTADTSYDYQPDCSPDGRWVVYVSYRADALELRVLDLQTGSTQALTGNGAVNVEPRFSPDGRRLVFVSTQFNRRFHLFTADFHEGSLANVKRLTGERRSSLPRYYYSAFDHEISPAWKRDGREILYVSNRDHLYGTGGFWRTAASPDADADPATAPAQQMHYEETNWKARPDFSPDGSRLVYSSYLGRSWHNLWLLPAGGGDPFPLTYGDWDQTNPRWSPDGGRIAFISNRPGTTTIDIVTVPGGDVRSLSSLTRLYLQPQTTLRLDLHDAAGKPASARVSVTDAAGLFHAPANAWIHADDGFDRKERPFEAHYFHARGEAVISVPAGAIDVEILHGFERRFERHRLVMRAGEPADLAVNLDEGVLHVPDPGRWVSADVHVHMNYGGVYRNSPQHLVTQAEAEGLGIVNALIVNKEQRFPDIAHNGGQRDTASQPDALVVHGQEYHTSYWGHLGLLDIRGSIILPGYAGYPNTAAASLYPMNADIADLGHARGALVGYVHPFDDAPEPLAQPRQPLSNELPIDVALGKVDYMEILGFSDHRTTADVWYRLLNLGFRIPAAGGTDAMANFASLRGPVGMNRVYAHVPDAALSEEDWLSALKTGRTFATNGPLLGFTLGGAAIGDELQFAAGRRNLAYSLRVESIVPVDRLELVCNGRVMRTLKGPLAHGSFTGTIALTESGWCVLRASTEGAHHPVLDNYVYATTSPIYITIAGRKPHAVQDARFFTAWVDRVAETTAAYPDWNSATEKAGVLARLAQARAVFAAMSK